jgi:hypothetical protein
MRQAAPREVHKDHLRAAAEDPVAEAALERFIEKKREFNLVDLFPEVLGDPNSGNDDDEALCTRFYFTPQSHASTAQGCLFDSSAIPGFARKDDNSPLEVLHYMTHIIFKVFRCRKQTLTDDEYDDRLLALPLVADPSMTQGEQDAALRRGLEDLYRERYYTSIEVFMSSGTEGQQCGDSKCGLRPMRRVHAGISPRELAALNQEIAATVQAVAS